MKFGIKVIAWMAVLAAATPCAPAQPLTMGDVSRARESLTRSKGLTEAERGEIAGLYDQAAQQLQQEIRWKALQVGHIRTETVIRNELASARAAAVLPLAAPPPTPPSETAQQVEEELTRVRNDRASRIKMRDELSKLQASLVKRGDAITARQAEIREDLQSTEDEITVLPRASASPLWEQASRMSLQARRQSLQQELLALSTEREALILRKQLIPLQREAALLKVEAYEQYLVELDARMARARRQDAKKSLDGAVTQAQFLAKGFPHLSAMAADIARRATDLWGPNGIEAKSDRAAALTEQMRSSSAQFMENMASTRRRFENSGVFAPAGEWWPPRVEKLGKPGEVGVLLLGFSAGEVVARRDVFRLEEERNSAPAFETELQQILAGSGKPAGDADFQEFKSRARSMLQLKRSVMSEYLTNSRTCLSRMTEAHRVAEELLLSIRELQAFVMQHALWARSVTGPVFPSITASADALLWFFSLNSWSQIVAGFLAARITALVWLAGLAALLALWFSRHRLALRLKSAASRAQSRGRLSPLFFDILRALLGALPAPLAIAYGGWVIGQAGADVDLGRAIEAGAGHASRFLLLALLVRGVLAEGGAADRLLGWSLEVRNKLDSAAWKLARLFTPLCFIFTALAAEGMYFHGDTQLQSHHNSLGRLCFMAACICVLVIGRRALKPGTAVSTALGTGYDSIGVSRSRVARMVLTLTFLGAVLLALLGFYITAYLLVENVIRTAGFTLGLMLVSGLVHQWRQERQQAATSESHSPQGQAIAQASELQVRRLSRFGFTLIWIAGLFIIWSAALPALSMLKKVELLPEFRVITERTAAPPSQARADAPKADVQESPPARLSPIPIPTPQQPAEPAQPREPLYLTDLLLAIFIALLTAMLVGNIPGLLQFTVFRRVRLDMGGQYAVNTIARYFVIMIGLVVVSGMLGLNWSKIQWLAAALTFGIGFGLQEIFANFAAGLILLLDRSIRVGDVVTVGNLSGIVARIQMRATTVTLWDCSDMVVPNKEFITTKLVNWTLSNPETRVDLKVGVDYRSDVEQVREVLMRIAKEHPAVLATPEPQVLLTEFAASSINFELRVFGLYSYGRPVLLDELHRAVVREFRHLGIDIAFPQLDVHLKPPPSGGESPGS